MIIAFLLLILWSVGPGESRFTPPPPISILKSSNYASIYITSSSPKKLVNKAEKENFDGGKFKDQMAAFFVNATTAFFMSSNHTKEIKNKYAVSKVAYYEHSTGSKSNEDVTKLYLNDKQIMKALNKLTAFSGGKTLKKKILILMSDTGGGHRASAQALDQALQEQYPGKFSVNILDIWTEHAPAPFNGFVNSYRFLARNPLLWRVMYAYGNFPITKRFTESWSWKWCYGNFRSAMNATQPDLVVSVHPLCNQIPLAIVAEFNKERRSKAVNDKYFHIPFLTVVTDLGGAHKTWFDRKSDAIFVPSKAVADEARKNKILPDRLIEHGLPVRPSFWKPALPKEKLRHKLGLSKGKTALLMGGGDGVGSLGAIAERVIQKLSGSPDNSQVIVVCGHNKKLSSSLTSKKWPSNVRVVVKGFVSNVDEYMAASDLLVTKAGPGTIAEAMIRGLPIVLSSFLPGQVRTFIYFSS